MAKRRGKKYDTTVTNDAGQFLARVIRRGTSEGTTVEREARFDTRDEALEWAKVNLAEYLQLRKDRSTRRSESKRRTRAARRTKEEWLKNQTFKSLAEAIQTNHPYADAAMADLKWRADLLHDETAFRAFKDGANEVEAFRSAKEAVGPRRERMERALSGVLDALHMGMHAAAVARAKAILTVGLAMRGEPVPEGCELPAVFCH